MSNIVKILNHRFPHTVNYLNFKHNKLTNSPNPHNRDRSIVVMLAEMMITVVTVGVFMMPAEEIRHLPTVPDSIQVSKAALLFA